MILSKSVKASIVILAMFLLCVNLSACSFPQPKPQEGIWYCEELMIEIDFNNAKNTQHCAKIFNPDGTYRDISCLFDYGSLIWLCSEDRHEDYLRGNFRYKNDLFYVTTMDRTHTYVFVQTDNYKQNF